MLYSYSGANALNHRLQDDPRTMRLAAEARKLVAATRNYILSKPDLVPLGGDPLVTHLVASAGFNGTEVQVTRVGAKGRVVTVLSIPTRIWKDPENRTKLFDIKRQARVLKAPCILVPQRWLKAPVRSSVARVLSATRNTFYGNAHRAAVMEYLNRVRISVLSDTASVIRDHDDPIGAVLAMACHGLVDIDRRSPIAASSLTAAPAWAAQLVGETR